VRKTKLVGILLLLIGVTGCSDVINGSTQDIAVSTYPKSGASCMLRNGRGGSILPATPASVTVGRSSSPLNIKCQTEDGWDGSTTLNATNASGPIDGLMNGWIGDPNTDAAFAYPDHADIVLAQHKTEAQSSTGDAAVHAPMSALDPAADRARINDDNVAMRFRALQVLFDEGLITTEEFNTRRGANLGVLLRYSLVPGARDLERRPPPPPQLVARLKYLAAAYAEHSISASEQAAERQTILEGLLPAHPLRRADPPPPIKDQLQLAAEIGRIERLRVASVISDKEAAAEKAKVTQLLDASIAAADAAARLASGVAVSGAAPSVTGVGVALASYASDAQARKGWAGLQKTYPDELGALRLSVKVTPRPHNRPSSYRILAGPLPDSASAANICRILKRRGVACDTTDFSE